MAGPIVIVYERRRAREIDARLRLHEVIRADFSSLGQYARAFGSKRD